jgi:hypothetical protein
MSIDAELLELLELARAIEGYDTRLQLMSKNDRRNPWFRREIEERRAAAAARLAQLEAARGWRADEPPSVA